MRAAAEVTLASQREQMLDAARQEQVVLVQQAHRERDEAVRLRREAAGGNRMVCPNWLSHRVVRFVEGSSVMYIRVPLTIRFREFTRDVIGRDGLTVTHHWRIPEEQQPVTTHQMFLALNTSTWAPMLASSYVEVDSNGRMLPHANQSQFCVEPQGMPMEVRNWEGVVAVAALVARAYHVVNLGSLLTRYSQWPRQLQEVTPEPFRVDSINDIDWSAAIAALVGDRHEAIPANVEAATTWQVEVQRAR